VSLTRKSERHFLVQIVDKTGKLHGIEFFLVLVNNKFITVCERACEWLLLSVNGIIFMNGKTRLGGRNYLPLPLIIDLNMCEKVCGKLCVS
jgi:hypothetical protein